MNLTYLDNNATTQVASEVIEAMLPALRETFGNPSSTHQVGQRAAFLVAQARELVASCINAQPDEIVFTSGGTESDNLAIRGLLRTVPDKNHLIISCIEHEAVMRVAEALEQQGYEVTYLSVSPDGQLDLEELRRSLRDNTALVSVMLSNNETGIIFPLQQIAQLCHENGTVLHTDAVQGLGKIRIDVKQMDVDMLSLSAHKFHGPKGVGALYVRKGLLLESEILGGNQERGLRASTENVPGIVGLGAAAGLVDECLKEMNSKVRQLRDRMEQGISDSIPRIRIIGKNSPRVPNTSNIIFEGLNSEKILIGLSEEGICASGGSACHSGALKPSRVLLQMGIESDLASRAIRLSLSRYNSQKDIDHLLKVLPVLANKLQSQSTGSSPSTDRVPGKPSCS